MSINRDCFTPRRKKISTPALYLSNWQDLIAIWKASRLTQTDTLRMPRIGELHDLGGSGEVAGANQIKAYTGFFRDESANKNYTKPGDLDAQAWFESDREQAGTITSRYIGYGPNPEPRVTVFRSFAGVPGQPFFITRYRIENPTEETINWNLLDQLLPAAPCPPEPRHGWYDAKRNALFVDRGPSHELSVLMLGAFQDMDGLQVGAESETDLDSPKCSGWFSFDHNGTLHGNQDLVADDLELTFQKKLSLRPRESAELYFYLSAQSDLASAREAAEAAVTVSGSEWFTSTAAAYTEWLENGKRRVKATHGALETRAKDAELETSYDRSLILIKNCQQPKLGTFPATTNPFAYGHRTWARDASITAMALDASGHYEEAATYWRWMAEVQRDDGTWDTTYSFWDGTYIQFVEPEYDSVGAFLYGVHRHHEATRPASPEDIFGSDLEPAVKKAADWILRNLQPNGFGEADYSIWEEPERGLEHNVYTQAWYVAGLYAVQKFYERQGQPDLADWFAGGPASILTAMQRPIDWQPPGLWNPYGYYIRGVGKDNTVHERLHDTSSNILFVLGVLDVESGRSAKHVSSLIALLTHERYGIGRYEADPYYDISPFDPAGDEAHGTTPMWPQMSNWVSIYESLVGQRENALSRLHWYVSVTGIGYTPPGEAVSYVTGLPILSSMSEPLTAASFILARLVSQRRLDLRIFPPMYNAGAWKTIQHGSHDRSQWQNVPYFVGNSAAPMDTIRRVYLANDNINVYLRIDTYGGAGLSSKLRVYTGDFANVAPTTARGVSEERLKRPASFVLEGGIDSSTLQRASVTEEGTWTEWFPSEGSKIHWDTPARRIEALIPISALCSRQVPERRSSWTKIIVMQIDGEATVKGHLLINYRLSLQNQSWIYGNIEQ